MYIITFLEILWGIMFSSKTFQWHVCAGYLASKNGIPQAHTYFSFIALKGKKQKKKKVA